MIKKILTIFITLLPICYLNFNLASNDIEKIQIIKEPFYIESLELTNYKGESVFLKEKLSSYFIINFWASWCAPCIKEMKSLNTLQEKASFLRILTVSEDKNMKIAKEFFKKNKHPSLEKYYDKDKLREEMIRAYGSAGEDLANAAYIMSGTQTGAEYEYIGYATELNQDGSPNYPDGAEQASDLAGTNPYRLMRTHTETGFKRGGADYDDSYMFLTFSVYKKLTNTPKTMRIANSSSKRKIKASF